MQLPPPEDIQTLSAIIVKNLAGLAAIGGLTMAFIQVLKEQLPLRQIFNETFLKTWVRDRLQDGGQKKAKRNYGWRYKAATNQNLRKDLGIEFTTRSSQVEINNKSILENSVEQTLEYIYDLATGGHRRALLDLDVEQFCGQISSASQVALEYPRRYPEFCATLLAGAEPEDIQEVFKGNPVANAIAEGKDSKAVSENRKQYYLDARTRANHFAQRSIDAIHIRLGARWNWWLQLAGFGFSVGITFLAMFLPGVREQLPASPVLVLCWCFLAGFLAPVAHDLVAAIRSRT